MKQKKALQQKELLQADAQRIQAITMKELNDEKEEQIKNSKKRE